MKLTLIVSVISAVIAALLAWFLTHQQAEIRYQKNDHQWQVKWDGMLSANQKALDEQRKKIDAAHQKTEQTIAAAEAEYQHKLEEQQDDANQTIASYRAGNLQLRQQFRCATNAAAVSASAPIAAPVLSDETRRCGLSETDVRNLVRLASKADEVTQQLTLAQKIIRQWYKQINGEELTYANP